MRNPQLEVNINLANLGAMFLYDSKTGLRDIVGFLLSAEGVPDEFLDGFVGPHEVAIAILIEGRFPAAKDIHVMMLNAFLKPDSTFTTAPEVMALMQAQDAAFAEGKMDDPTTRMELRALAFVLGYKINFIEPIEGLGELELYNVGE